MYDSLPDLVNMSIISREYLADLRKHVRKFLEEGNKVATKLLLISNHAQEAHLKRKICIL